MINSDKVAAWLRTAVPTGWGALIAFLLSRFPAVHEFLVSPAVTMIVTGLASVAWYSLWKWLEPRLPAWATVLVLGFDRPPVYFPGEIYDNGYQAGQDDAVMPVSQADPAAMAAYVQEYEETKRRAISRPGESSGPHALTDIMPTVPADKDQEEPRRDG